MRHCARCHTDKPVGSFLPRGIICRECKLIAVNTFNERRRKSRKKSNAKKQSMPRMCVKCEAVKPADQFALFGKICWECKSIAQPQSRCSNTDQLAQRARKRAVVAGGTIYCMGEAT